MSVADIGKVDFVFDQTKVLVPYGSKKNSSVLEIPRTFQNQHIATHIVQVSYGPYVRFRSVHQLSMTVFDKKRLVFFK